ncbi:Sigma-70, region 4 type 2 [Lactococcus lactis subsp. lactis A12]|uniref:Sigma-70, region 4 type 2 n=1 Tax=Lactococcus lactis subsp. lactis A12 TaxID=1137134 RepID=S6FEQ7_LACLL|nr:sigma-70 family RNA polymerase sigma factor [Lactococcus lactis]CDG03761.1 Sigma-70, region 4 type 2 [Lactococcus lactis subsp. lactis A12]
MRQYKTSSKRRETYKYYFVDGTIKNVEVENEVTSQDIAQLHQWDDEVFDANRREDYHVSVHYESVSEVNDEKNLLLIDEISPLDILIQREEASEHSYLLQKLRFALQNLTPKQQATLEKVFVQKMSYTAIAKEEGVGESAIRSRLNKIKKKLKKKF